MEKENLTLEQKIKTELGKEHNLYDWLFLEYFNKLRMNGCTKVAVHLKTDNEEEYIISSTEVGEVKDFISSFSED